ncbi:MAG: cytochrome c [Deltaproteobacteria bacterium]|jgi:mono/diheme cytochrome c family protein|nr:cytochrome c [Deltaproteobacteria bacterium]
MRALWITLVSATLVAGCIGAESSEPPIVGIRNMYNQPRYDTQERQPFFADQRSMRPDVEGTVSRESERLLPWATGRDANDEAWVMEVPQGVVNRNGGPASFLARGKERYEIYCAPCHSLAGDGKGMVSRRAGALGASGLVAPSFHDDRLRHIPDGQLYATIKNGLRNMPAYAHNIPVDDRWAIVQYIRALQLSQMPDNTEQSQ